MNENLLVLTICATSKGFGYAIMEGPDRLVDWGVKDRHPFNRDRSLRQFASLVKLMPPELVLTPVTQGRAVGSQRKRDLLAAIRDIAHDAGIRTAAMPRGKVLETFAHLGKKTKQQRAQFLVQMFPELGSMLPAPRKPWMSEDARMSIFEAAAQALAFFGKLPDDEATVARDFSI